MLGSRKHPSGTLLFLRSLSFSALPFVFFFLPLPHLTYVDVVLVATLLYSIFKKLIYIHSKLLFILPYHSCCSYAFQETNSLRRTMQIVESSLLYWRAHDRVSS